PARPFLISGCHVFPDTSGAVQRSAAASLARDLVRLPWRERLDKLADVRYAFRVERLGGANLAATLADADVVIVRQSLGVPIYEKVAKRVVFIPFGIDPALFPPRPGPGDGRIVFAGALRPYKGVDTLLRAFAKLASHPTRASLVIAGEGEDRAHLEALARELGIAPRVSFLGHVPRYEIPKLLEGCSALALPSRGESFGQIALEAMSMSRPVVVSDRITGAYDYLEEGMNGFMVPAGGVDELASRLAFLVDEPDAADRMGRAARKTAERFTWSEVAKRHVALYREVTRAG
ncbi:MAG: glycosyltransferase family 4 protein, partial [Thermoplasmatota archaeon]